MVPAPVQEADRAGAARRAMWAIGQVRRRTLSAFFNRPFGLPFGGHLQRRAAQPYTRYAFSPPAAVSAAPKAQRRRHGVWEMGAGHWVHKSN